MPVNRSLFLKSLQVFFVRGFGAAAGFLLTLVVTNSVSSNDAGLFFLCLAIASALGMLLTLGSPQALIRIVGANSGDCWPVINQQLSVILKLVLGLSLLCLAVFYTFSSWIALDVFRKPELAAALPMTGLATLLFALVQVFAAALQGAQRGVFASLVQNVITPLSFIALVMGVMFLYGDLDALDLLWVYTLGLGLAVLAGLLAWNKDPRSAISYQRGFPRELRASLYPLFIVSVMTLCVQWAGQLAVGRYLAPEQIAYFAAAQRTALLASFVLIAVNLVVAPKFARAFAENSSGEVNHLSRLSSRLMLLMAAPVLVVMLLFPKFLMDLFGEGYVVAAPLLQIMAVGQFINVMTGSVGYLLTMTSHEKDMRNVVLFSGPLAVVLAFLLTKEYGLFGAAYATAISVATQNLLAVYMVKKRLGFNTLNIFRRTRV